MGMAEDLDSILKRINCLVPAFEIIDIRNEDFIRSLAIRISDWFLVAG